MRRRTWWCSPGVSAGVAGSATLSPWAGAPSPTTILTSGRLLTERVRASRDPRPPFLAMPAATAAHCALLLVCCSAVLAASPGPTGSGRWPVPRSPALAFALAPPACCPGGVERRTWAAAAGAQRPPVLAAAALGERCRVRSMLRPGPGAALAMAAGEGGAAPAGKQSTHAHPYECTCAHVRMHACLALVRMYAARCACTHARTNV